MHGSFCFRLLAFISVSIARLNLNRVYMHVFFSFWSAGVYKRPIARLTVRTRYTCTCSLVYRPLEFTSVLIARLTVTTSTCVWGLVFRLLEFTSISIARLTLRTSTCVCGLVFHLLEFPRVSIDRLTPRTKYTRLCSFVFRLFD